MEIHPFDRSITDVINQRDVSSIATDGISIRTGNKVLRLQVTEEVVVDDTDSVKKELEDKFHNEYLQMVSDMESYKQQLKFTLDKELGKTRRKQDELDRRMNETSILPQLTRNHLHQGLSVAINERGGLVWSFKTVYAPKFVSNRRIDPSFAKRLVTPIAIEVWTNGENKIHKLIVRQILGNKKFHHYHSMSQSSDCWGNLKYDGVKIDGPDEMIEYCKEVSLVLETINDMSIGTNNPRGLSRFSTVEKHLLKANDDDQPARSRTATNTRNARAGVDVDANMEAAQNVWTV